MRARVVFIISALAILLISLWWRSVSIRSSTSNSTSGAIASTLPASMPAPASADFGPTKVKAHNLLLRKGPNFRVYIRWLRGELVRTRREIDPSFDDPESFFINVRTGVLRANIGDLNQYLNTIQNSPIRNVALSGDGNQFKLKATVHKIIPLPVELTGTIMAAPDNRIQMHIAKINVLRVPLKGLLGRMNVTPEGLFRSNGTPGVTVSGDDIFLDTQKLLPPPHLRGQLTAVRIVNPDLEETYGNAENAVTEFEQWRNFLQLSGGTIDFGKLTMRHVDLIMIDISNDAWFDLDLAHYQEQLVNGYTHMTPEAGLQIFMPDLDELPHTKANQRISMEWLKNRNAPPPADVAAK
ncbi:MAG: hypothetical protein JO159_16520 [Acidobacteria bacterium]|nr:hypothetical protein [Acidobacteriota bacterium]MBV9625926.1 hypothetical protein [Acidobacteriota bacterium]